jgi:hypothetical protein
MLLGRIGGGPWQPVTDKGGSRALDDDDMEDDNDGSRGGGLISINVKDGQVGVAMGSKTTG